MDENTHTDKFYVRRLEASILENIARKGNVIDVEDIKVLTKLNLDLAQGKDYAVLVDSEEMTSVTTEAMDYSAKVESSVKTIARAFMINSLPNRIVGNFYLQIKKPLIKTKLFTEKEKAIDWLREQVRLHEEKRLNSLDEKEN